jgi:hypothetical protein
VLASLHSKQWHEALAGLVADGKTTRRGAPRNPLQLGATFWFFRRESRVTLAADQAAEPHTPDVVGGGESFRSAPLLRPVGQQKLRGLADFSCPLPRT